MRLQKRGVTPFQMIFDKFEMLSLDFSKNGCNFDISKSQNGLNYLFGWFQSSSKNKTFQKKDGKTLEKTKSNRIKLSTGTRFTKDSGLRPYVQLACSQLFNENGSFKLSYLPPRTTEANFIFPLFLNNKDSLEMNITSRIRNILNVDVHSRVHSLHYKSKIDFSCFYEILQETTKLFYIKVKNKETMPFQYKTKVGVANGSVFSKLDFYLKKYFELPKRFFYNLKLHIGTIYGNPHRTDRYFLGESIRGYAPFSISPLDLNEKIGGLSCFEISNSFGWSMGILKFFGFTDLGFSSSQRNLLDTFYSTFKSILITFRPASFGISTGIGMSVNLQKTKRHSMDLTLSYGLASARSDEKRPLQLGLDLNIH